MCPRWPRLQTPELNSLSPATPLGLGKDGQMVPLPADSQYQRIASATPGANPRVVLQIMGFISGLTGLCRPGHWLRQVSQTAIEVRIRYRTVFRKSRRNGP
jgi:hypothetical protein